MYSLLLLAGSSFALCLWLTPLCRDWFERAGLVDQPDQLRRTHAHAVPRVGGVPIVLAYLGAYGILLLTPLGGGLFLAQNLPLTWKLLPATAVIFAAGLWDDLAGLKPWQKLASQAGAAGLAYWAGVRILGIAGFAIGDWWSLPLTIVWLVGCANAFNLIDGVDGLASGIGFFATLTTLIAALLHGNAALALATAPLAGALLAFLRYNFAPASIFLGDSGSLLIGFLLGCYGVLWSQKTATLLAMTAPLMVLAVPIVDVLLSIVRRFLRNEPIFTGDRGHIHHRLLDRGLTPRRVVLVLYAVCGLGAALALLQSVAHNHYSGIVLVLFCGAACLGIQNLGYVEFEVAGRVLLGGAFRRVLGEQFRLRRLEESLSAAGTVNDCWVAVRDTAAVFGFSHIEVKLNGETYESRLNNPGAERAWTMRIPITASDWVNCTRAAAAASHAGSVALFADTLARVLRQRLPQLRPSGAIDPQLAALAHSVGGSRTLNSPVEATSRTSISA